MDRPQVQQLNIWWLVHLRWISECSTPPSFPLVAVEGRATAAPDDDAVKWEQDFHCCQTICVIPANGFHTVESDSRFRRGHNRSLFTSNCHFSTHAVFFLNYYFCTEDLSMNDSESMKSFFFLCAEVLNEMGGKRKRGQNKEELKEI